MNKLLKYITGSLVVFLLILAFFAGWNAYSKFRPCPEIRRDTIYVYDTVIHYIPDTVPYYYVTVDSLVIRDTIPRIVDTTQILLDYFMYHYYTRTWEDTLIKVTLSDVITENKFLDATFSYKLLKPIQVINNSVTNFNYSSYLYLGGSVPVNDIKLSSTDVYFANKRLLFGVGYIPYSKGVRITAGFKLIKFNK